MTEATPPIPSVGDTIYVETHAYIDRGEDDVDGGLAQVTAVKTQMGSGKPAVFVSVKEHPGHSYNWEFLGPQQRSLAEHYGNTRAKASPDLGSVGL